MQNAIATLIRPLVPSLLAAGVAAALLVSWIRFRPVAMPHTLQLALAICLVVVVAGVVTLACLAAQQAEAG